MENAKSQTKKNLDLVKTILFFVLVGLLSSYILIEAFLPDTTVRVFGFKPYVVITRSMEPEIDVNDLVIVKNFDADELEVGDIITFYADIDYNGEKDVVTHYIYSITENSQGDLIFRTNRYYENEADVRPDTWFLAESDILGLYSFHIPRIGTIVRFVQSPFGIAAIIVNVGVIIAIVQIVKRTEKKVETKEEDIKPEA